MSFEERFRHLLEHRATQARVSPDAWERISARVGGEGGTASRRWRRPAIAAMAVAASVAVALAVALRPLPERLQTGPAAPSDQEEQPAVPYDGIWPSSQESLARAQEAAERGEEAWRFDPVAVARAYLEERGLERVTGLRFEDGGDAGIVFYELAGDTAASERRIHQVLIARSDARSVWYVTGALTGRLLLPGESRALPALVYASPLEVDVAVHVPGMVVAGAGRFDSEWSDEQKVTVTRADVARGSEVVRFSLRLDDPLPDALLVRVLHRDASGLAALAELRVDRPGAAGGSHDSCGVVSVPESDQYAAADADDALREWFRSQRGTQLRPAELAGTGFAGEADGPPLRAERFTVVGDRERKEERAVICARTYWSLDALLVGYTEDAFVLTRDDPRRWDVVAWQRGPWRDAGETKVVRVAFLEPGVDCGEEDHDYRFVAVAVPGRDDAARAALLELLTGPTSADHVTAIAAHGRLNVVEVRGGVARADFSRGAAPEGGSCWVASVVGQIQRTLKALPGVTRAILTVEGEAPENSFQP